MDVHALPVILAGFLYIATPGPVFLAIMTLVAERGRTAVLRFLAGSLIGTSFWLVFTTASIIEAHRLPPALLDVLALACSAYLGWIAYKMFRNARAPGSVRIFHRPTLEGTALGFLNPKSYPVMMSVFSALILGRGAPITWADFPAFFSLAFCGFILGHLVLVSAFGIGAFKRVYARFAEQICYAFSALYLGFGLHLLWQAL
jgi:threonine efflux protein